MSLVDKLRGGRTVRRATYFAVAALLSMPCLAAADEVFGLTTTVPITGLASFDISWVDSSLHAYFLADRSNKSIDVIGTDSKVLSHQFKPGFVGFSGNNNTSGPNGVMTVPLAHDHDHDGDDGHGRAQIWAGDGGSKVWVLDYPSGDVVTTISTGTTANRADEMCHDPNDHLVLVANDADTPPFITFISTETLKIVKQIKFDGAAGDGPNATNGIEQCQWNAREGKFYLNLPEVNGPGNDTADGNVVVIDPHSFKIVQKFVIPVADCAGPQGMAIGPAPQIALGCNAPSIPSGVRNSVVINEENGNIIRTLANEGGSDEAWFNPSDGHYFFANSTPGSKTSPPGPQFLGIVDSRGDQLDQTVTTATSTTVGSHSVAADPDRNQAYVPVAGAVNIYSPSGRDDGPVFVFRDHDHD
jgi:hypothetical protein